MKKAPNLILAFVALAAASCNNTVDNNHGLDYDSLDVNFSSAKTGSEWTVNDVVGIHATCTRNGEENVRMSINSPACFSPVSTGETANLVKKSEDDNIIALAGDHNFKFYAYCPYDASVTDMSQLPADIPSQVKFGEDLGMLYVASANVTSVVAPVAMDFNAIACLLNLQIPDDIVSASSTVLKKMVIKAAEGAQLEDDIAYDAWYNIYTGEVTRVAGSGSREIVVDFGYE